MSIRDLARAAVVVENDEAERRRDENWKQHARAAEQLVKRALGLSGTTVSARRDSPAEITEKDPMKRPVDWGHHSTVKVMDDDLELLIEVTNRSEKFYRQYGGDYYGPIDWRLLVVNIDGVSLQNNDRASYRSGTYSWRDVKFLDDEYKWRKTGHIAVVASLADVGRLLQAWEEFQIKRDESEAKYGKED